MKPQMKRVLGHMSKHGSITALNALQFYGVMSLSSRICDLEKEGFKIKRKTIAVHNRFGECVHVTQYSLKEKK